MTRFSRVTFIQCVVAVAAKRQPAIVFTRALASREPHLVFGDAIIRICKIIRVHQSRHYPVSRENIAATIFSPCDYHPGVNLQYLLSVTRVYTRTMLKVLVLAAK